MTVVGWFVGTVWLTAWIGRRLLVGIGTTFLYWFFVVWGALAPLFLGVAGYPFINPCIPLATQHWFLSFVCVCGALCGLHDGAERMRTHIPMSIGYVQPCYKRVDLRGKHASWLAHKLAHSICMLNTNSKDTKGVFDALLVAPETSFPYALNMLPESLSIISGALEKEQQLLLGSIYQRGGDLFQCVYWIQGRLIRNFYVKKLLAPFSERVPYLWRWLICFAPLCSYEFSDKTEGEGVEIFDVDGCWRVQPRICFEFFFMSYDQIVHERGAPRTTTFFFVNDSWFDFVFRSMLYNLAALKANLCGMPMVYIGHYGCDKIWCERGYAVSELSCFNLPSTKLN